LDTCDDRKIVHWCRSHTFSHSSKGLVNGTIINATQRTLADTANTLKKEKEKEREKKKANILLMF